MPGVPPITQTYESYVIPNASCPVCREPVFFYQSENGGRVFFDDLGPPWPKHRCTDSSSYPKQITSHSITNILSSNNKYLWEKEGWQPFFILSVSKIGKYSLKVSGVTDGKKITFNIQPAQKHHVKHDNISTDCIAHLLKGKKGGYKLSIATTIGGKLSVKNYTLNANLPSGQPLGISGSSAMAMAFSKARKKSE